MLRFLSCVVAAVSAAGCTAVDATAPEVRAPAPAVYTSAPVRVKGLPMPCLGYNGLNDSNPAGQVMAGRFRSPQRAPVQVAGGADVNWALDPWGDRTWQLWFNSLEWTGSLIQEFAAKGDRAALDRAAAIVRDWITDNGTGAQVTQGRREAIEESTKFRLVTLTCLRRHYSADWLDRAIDRHAAWLADPRHWSGPWNHGTDESMILMSAGCATGRRDFADLGYERLLTAVFRPPGGVRPAIDAEGAHNEQSTQYAVYNRGRWRRAMEAVRACGRTVPAELERRHALMDEFVALQATPAGDLVQIGESQAARLSGVSAPGKGPLRFAASRGRAGTRPAARARVYEAGYVMGRSGWGDHGRAFTKETHYTARFGPGPYAHGQNDHLSLTFFAEGRDILVHSGHIGYNDPSWRAWLKSPQAHSAVVVPAARFDSGAYTHLVGHRFSRGADYFRFSDTAFQGTTRTRSVLAASDPDALVVLDRAQSAEPRVVNQLWHLPADFTATANGADAVATAGRVRTHFIRIPLPGDPATEPPATIHRGERQPDQGWVVRAYGEPRPAPVVDLTAEGTDVRILTVIAPTRGDRPSVRSTTEPDGRQRVRITFSGATLDVEVSADGGLRRLR